MSDYAAIPLTQVLREEYESFHGEAFPSQYLTWTFYKDHLANPARFAIKLYTIKASEAPDSFEVNLRNRIEAKAPGELRDYIIKARQQAADCTVKEFDELDADARPDPPPDSLQAVIVDELNKLLNYRDLYRDYFPRDIVADVLNRAGVTRTMKDLETNGLKDKELFYVNRLLLEQAYPNDILPVNQTLSGIYAHIHTKKHSAICLSGGGIRSASFGLGILQSLARHNLLDLFNYLSTVSGGGYLGGWLSAWIHRHPQHVEGVLEDLANQQPKSKLDLEPEPIRHLRDYSNYLSPKLGFLSADTWTLVSTYFRNLLLNWLVLVPLIAAVLMIPRISVPVIKLPLDGRHYLLWVSFLIGFVSAAAAIGYMGLHRPSNGSRAGQTNFLMKCLAPLLLSAVVFTTYWAWLCNSAIGVEKQLVNQQEVVIPINNLEVVVSTLGHRLPQVSWVNSLAIFVAYGILLHIGGMFWWGIVRLIQRLVSKVSRRENHSALTAEARPDQPAGFRNGFREAILVILTGAFGGWAAWLIAFKLFAPLKPKGWYEMAYVSFASPLYLILFLLVVTLFAGLSSRWTIDEDREWWARFGGWVLIGAAVWCILGPLVIYGPVALSAAKATIASIGGISGVITLWLGRSSKTSAGEKGKDASKLTSIVSNYALKVAAPLFAAFIVIIISVLITLLDRWLADKLSLIDWNYFQAVTPISENWGNGIFAHLAVVRDSQWWYVVALTAAFVTVGILMARIINTNKFSLHAMYRNRLIRAYLGASNDKRYPNMFTGFDENDNLQMYELWPNKKTDTTRSKLLHVVNMALNLVGGDKLAWQQRKAESFTVSPLHAGNDHLQYRRTEYPAQGHKRERYYGGTHYDDTPNGISLGTAITISGAAASPNMGYHSSSFVTFLLSLFNVRLGWWLGNTGEAGDDTFYLDAPKVSVRPIVAETLGLTNDENPYIYLSDGGHFENLGLYEMVRRRCHFILISDAGQDPKCSFEDLGNAVRKIRIDLGVPVEFDPPICIYARSDDEERNRKGRYCAIGRIRYSCVDNPPLDEPFDKSNPPTNAVPDGIVIYVKPAFYENEPRDIYQYAKANLSFPHESTADQFFSESQLESYRALGSHVMDKILDKWQEGDSQFDDFYPDKKDRRHPKAKAIPDYFLLKDHIIANYLGGGRERGRASRPSPSPNDKAPSQGRLRSE